MKKIGIINALIGVAGWLIAVSPAVGQPIAVRASSPQAEVRLPENPSTGYQWVLAQYDQRWMSPPSHYYLPAQKNLVGAPGYAVWQFKFKPAAFVDSRKTTVVLEYKRVWEKYAIKKQVIRFNIQSN